MPKARRSASVVPLKTARDEWAEGAIGVLERALEEARANPRSAVGVFWVSRDGRRGIDYSAESVTTVIGGLFTLASEMSRVD